MQEGEGGSSNLVRRRTQLFEKTESDYADPAQTQRKTSKTPVVDELEGKFNKNLAQNVERVSETGVKLNETGKPNQYGVRILPSDTGSDYRNPQGIMGKPRNSGPRNEDIPNLENEGEDSPVIWAHRIPNKLKVNEGFVDKNATHDDSNSLQVNPAMAAKRPEIKRQSVSRKPAILRKSRESIKQEPSGDSESSAVSIADRINLLTDPQSKENARIPPPRPKYPVFSHNSESKGIYEKPNTNKNSPIKPKGPPPSLPSREKLGHLRKDEAEIQDLKTDGHGKCAVNLMVDKVNWRHSYCDSTEFSNQSSPTSPNSVTSSAKKKPDRPRNPPPQTPKLKQQEPPVFFNPRKASLPTSPPAKSFGDVASHKAVQQELNKIYSNRNELNLNKERDVPHSEINVNISKLNDTKKNRSFHGKADTGSIRILPKYKEDLSTNPVREIPLETGEGTRPTISKPIPLSIPKGTSAVGTVPPVTSPTRKPPPNILPPKPPRTFKHEEYLEGKEAIRKATNQDVTVSTFKSGNIVKIKDKDNVLNGDYEEVDVKRGLRLNPPPRPTNPPPRNKIIQGKIPSPKRTGLLHGSINNPNYEVQHETIPIKTYTGQDGQLKRYKSDEFLYAEPKVSPKKLDAHVKDGRVSQVPGLLSPDRMDNHGVAFDQAGYAVPDIKGKVSTLHRTGMTRSPSMAQKKFRIPSDQAEQEQSVREKVSQVYSTVRRRPRPDSSNPAGSTSSTDDDDSDSNVDLEEHKDRLNHMMAQKATYASLHKTPLPDSVDLPQMFTYSLIVSLKNEGRNYTPYVMHKFPLDAKDNPAIPEFCFPDPSLCKPVRRMECEMFSFVMTDGAGVRQYGYCRKILPQGTKERLPEVVCVVSPLDAYGFYRNFLREMETQRQVSLEQVQHVLECAYGRPLPHAGQEAWIRYMFIHQLPVGTRDTLCIRRPKDLRNEQVTFVELIKQFKPDIQILLKVFGSILLERRIILTSCRLSILSSCGHALVSLLYPFTWQHTYIPVLPRSLIDVCASPAPFIVGVLTESLKDLDRVETEEVLIVDLDLCKLHECHGDEDRLLPNRIKKALAMAVGDDNGDFKTRNLMISEAFLRFFVETCGHHIHFFTEQQDGTIAFQKEMFMSSPPSKSLRMFLECFIETQMFEVFIRGKLDGTGTTTALFDDRVKDHQEEMAGMGPSLRANVRIFGKKMVNFMVESGGKLKKMFAARTEVT